MARCLTVPSQLPRSCAIASVYVSTHDAGRPSRRQLPSSFPKTGSVGRHFTAKIASQLPSARIAGQAPRPTGSYFRTAEPCCRYSWSSCGQDELLGTKGMAVDLNQSPHTLNGIAPLWSSGTGIQGVASYFSPTRTASHYHHLTWNHTRSIIHSCGTS